MTELYKIFAKKYDSEWAGGAMAWIVCTRGTIQWRNTNHLHTEIDTDRNHIKKPMLSDRRRSYQAIVHV